MSDTKKRLNITGKCFKKQNNADGSILSFLTNVPLQADTADLLFILTVPSEGQKFSPAYCRLQDKSKMKDVEEVEFSSLEDLNEIRSVGHLKETSRGNIIVCAPKEHRKVQLDKLVVIATIPADGKKAAPVYIRRKTYEKSKDELETKKVVVGDILVEEKQDLPLNLEEQKQQLIENDLIG